MRGDFAALCTALVLCACQGAPDAPGKDLFTLRCARCHSIQVPLSKHLTRAEWRRTIRGMRVRGARLTNDEASAVLEYLVEVRGIGP